MALKILTGKRHLLWGDDKNIIVDYHQEDGKAQTYFDDNTKEKFKGFSSNVKKDIDDKIEQMNLIIKKDIYDKVEQENFDIKTKTVGRG